METKKTKTKKVNVKALAEKYECTPGYVHQLLRIGSGDSIRAKKILKDAADIEDIINRETKVTL